MDKSDYITLLVALLAFIPAIIAQRNSAKSNQTAVTTTTIASRADLETEAFTRASTIYKEIIDRQASELKEVNTKYDALDEKFDKLEEKCDDLEDQNQKLRDRIIELELHEKEHHEH